jgi:hypothetical protein
MFRPSRESLAKALLKAQGVKALPLPGKLGKIRDNKLY